MWHVGGYGGWGMWQEWSGVEFQESCCPRGCIKLGRSIGRPYMRWADSIEYDMALAGVKLGTWQDVAMDRGKWKNVIKNIKTKKKRNKRKNTRPQVDHNNTAQV